MANTNPFQQQIKNIQWRSRYEKTTFRNELRLIPSKVYYVMAALSAAALVIVELVNAYQPMMPDVGAALSALAVGGIALGAAIAVSCLVFFFTYINRDAARRGMNATLWTLISIFVPYLIGALVYFLLRDALPTPCPQCGASVSARFNFCPACGYNLQPACPQCKRSVQQGDRFCPYCSHKLPIGSSVANNDRGSGEAAAVE
ncbi:MAG: zinc ribbon domain-containing protein [Terriglobia bacterium]